MIRCSWFKTITLEGVRSVAGFVFPVSWFLPVVVTFRSGQFRNSVDVPVLVVLLPCTLNGCVIYNEEMSPFYKPKFHKDCAYIA